jgi:hypothetical protein
VRDAQHSNGQKSGQRFASNGGSISTPDFAIATDRVQSWQSEPDLWAGGYWQYDWRYETQRVTRIDGAKSALTLAPRPRTYRRMRLTGEDESANTLLILGAFFVMVWIGSIGEDAFEKPFNTMPLYMFWGLILRLRLCQLPAAGHRWRHSLGTVSARS